MVLALAVAGTVTASLIPPQILKQVIDRNLVPKTTAGLSRRALLYLAALVGTGVFEFGKEATITILGHRITKEIRSAMMEKMGRLPARYFTTHEDGAIVSRFTNDVDTINEMFSGGIVGLAVDLLKIIGIVTSIWLFSMRLGIIVLLLLPFLFFVSRLFQRKMLQAQTENRQVIGKANNHIAESITNLLTIKANGKESFMERTYTKYLKENFETVDRVNFYDSIFPPIIQVTKAAVIALIVILSSPHLDLLGISLGMVAASIDLISNLFSPIESLGMELQHIQAAISGIRRVDEFCAEPEDDLKDGAITSASILSAKSRATLKFDHVSFAYEPDIPILQDFCLTVAECEQVTLLGRTGVGKSTVFKLALGLLKPTEGRITLNGTDVYAIPNSEKRKLFGYVDQDFSIIGGTVAQQVSLMDPSVTPSQIGQALQTVGLEQLIPLMDTPVSRLPAFSQGQKQLLAIARAIVTDPPVLLLDEITANLDSVTEKRLTEILGMASKNHTVLAVSHRISTAMKSDTLVILENGRIRSSGPPEKLVRTDSWLSAQRKMESLAWNN
jgi:ATP-binding cassette subfamily B protein